MTMTTLHPIKRAVLLPCYIASQFIRLEGRLGWLTLPQNPCAEGYEFHTSFETHILPYFEGLFDSAERTTDEDLRSFYSQKAGIAADLQLYYATSEYTGD